MNFMSVLVSLPGSHGAAPEGAQLHGSSGLVTAVPVSWGGKPLLGFLQETPMPAAAGLWLSGLTSGFVLTVPLSPTSVWFGDNKL